MKHLLRLIQLCLFFCLVNGSALGGETVPNSGEIISSFVVVGDNQVAKEFATPGDVSLANIAQLRQTLKDISTLNPKPTHIFITGDMVDHGEDEKGHAIADRLDAWAKIYRELSKEFGLKMPLVPTPGNHEMMKVVIKDGKPIEDFNPSTQDAWLKWLKRNRFSPFGGNGPTAKNSKADLLVHDESRMTYSFDDVAGNHFIIFNTFTLNSLSEPARGWVPYNWIVQDARKAEANPRVRHIYAFGHMPLRIIGFPYDAKGENSIISNEVYPIAQQLQETLGGLTKFRSYFCGHLHLWDCSYLPGEKGIWQVVLGNAGSKLIRRDLGAWQSPYFYGFTQVRIHQNGQVGVVSYQRPVPEPYYSSEPQPPAKPQPEIILLPGGAGAVKPQNHP